MIFGLLVETRRDMCAWLTSVCSMAADNPRILACAWSRCRHHDCALVSKSSDLCTFVKTVQLTLGRWG
jgi:hypothetical protein